MVRGGRWTSDRRGSEIGKNEIGYREARVTKELIGKVERKKESWISSYLRSAREKIDKASIQEATEQLSHV